MPTRHPDNRTSDGANHKAQRALRVGFATDTCRRFANPAGVDEEPLRVVVCCSSSPLRNVEKFLVASNARCPVDARTEGHRGEPSPPGTDGGAHDFSGGRMVGPIPRGIAGTGRHSSVCRSGTSSASSASRAEVRRHRDRPSKMPLGGGVAEVCSPGDRRAVSCSSACACGPASPAARRPPLRAGCRPTGQPSSIRRRTPEPRLGMVTTTDEDHRLLEEQSHVELRPLGATPR